MKLLSVNVSPPKEILFRKETIKTGIFKEPIQERVRLRTLNLDGDGQADLKAHGGIHKAAYAYPYEHYATWQQELNRDGFSYGQFGENFTTEGLTEDTVHIGDIFRFGNAVVEVTQPRVPCFKLAIKMDMPTFPKLFLASERSGFYLRVLEEGDVGAGDIIERIELGPEQMTVREINHLLYVDNSNVEKARQALRIPALAPGWHDSFQEIVAAYAG